MWLSLKVAGAPENDFPEEIDRKSGLGVLQRLDAELIRRGGLLRNGGVRDLLGYREKEGTMSMPSMLLAIDKFGEFFSQDDRVAQESSMLLDRLVRQGKAFDLQVKLTSWPASIEIGGI